MLWPRNVCYCQNYKEEDYLPSVFSCSPTDTSYWDVIDGGAQESALGGGQNKSAAYQSPKFTQKSFVSITVRPITPKVLVQCEWDISPSLRAQLSVLDDWATALHAYHVKGIVHGNLTPESVGVVHGRGTLGHPSQAQLPDRGVFGIREPADEEVYSARWAATELFHIDDGDPNPTKMSDVYSFACLMLQVLTGKVPYCGTKRAEQVVYLKYLGREPIDTQTPKVADHYVTFMRRCWSPEPETRPTMKIVVDFIDEEIRRLGGQRS